jgi:hypothetical protein
MSEDDHIQVPFTGDTVSYFIDLFEFYRRVYIENLERDLSAIGISDKVDQCG